MNPVTVVRKWRFLALAGAVAVLMGLGANVAPGSHGSNAQRVVISSDVFKGAMLIADGSESTGGKPTKPNHG